MALGGTRNLLGLSQRQIDHCVEFWEIMGGNGVCPLLTVVAHEYGTETRFVQARNVVVLGSNAYPGTGTDALSRMPMPCCLAHELAHAERHARGILRPFEFPDYYLEEAEASIHASFVVVLEEGQRKVLIEAARDQLDSWIGEA